MRNTNIEYTQEEEGAKSLAVLSHIDDDFIWSRFSSLSKLLRVLSYCRRVLNFKVPKNVRVNLPKYITLDETNKTLLI